jgi:hypothetical protein
MALGSKVEVRVGVSEEFPLSGGATADGVVRVGETVRKPPHRGSQRMREVLHIWNEPVLMPRRGGSALTSRAATV